MVEPRDLTSIAYSLVLDDEGWQQAVTELLDGGASANKRIDPLRAHVDSASKLRHAIRKHEQCTRALFPMIPYRESSTPRDALRYVIAGIAHAHGDAEHSAPNSGEIWNGIYAGTWSIVDHYEQRGRRYFFVYKTDVGELDPLRMTPLQRGALSCLSRGFGDAEIATTLRIKLDAASALVRSVKKKLRIPLRRDVIGLNEQCLRTIYLPSGDLECALLYSSTELSEVIPDSISDAERTILCLQMAGKNNNEIAQIRRVAYKTVSNQVATAYSKLNVRTCGEMLHNLRAACR
jgi:DNA-binding CsgD family transcriptional regulator